MDPNIRNLKDFLGLYNKVTELCFTRCVDNLSERTLSNHESGCVNNCVVKFARFNQKMMNVYVEVQTEINQKRLLELEENQRQIEQAKEESQKSAESIAKGQPEVIHGVGDGQPTDASPLAS